MGILPGISQRRRFDSAPPISPPVHTRFGVDEQEHGAHPHPEATRPYPYPFVCVPEAKVGCFLEPQPDHFYVYDANAAHGVNTNDPTMTQVD